jgi:DNA repair photolyase
MEKVESKLMKKIICLIILISILYCSKNPYYKKYKVVMRYDNCISDTLYVFNYKKPGINTMKYYDMKGREVIIMQQYTMCILEKYQVPIKNRMGETKYKRGVIMPVIYEPRGKAREYSELACNLYTGCLHKCKYCYCPAIRRQSLDEWANNPKARTNILKQLENDAKKLFKTDKKILFCFMSDPYQDEEAAFLTRQALLICEKYQFKNVNILTKAGFRAVKDFDIIKRNNWKFGSTIIFRSEEYRKEWEPGAPSIESRYETVKIAHKQNIFTWVSVEPVIYPDESLKVMQDLKQYVSKWKVGKLNHNKEIENSINWKQFYYDAKDILNGCDVYWKKDLLNHIK